MVRAIETRGLERRFGATRAVDGLDLSVASGEAYGFLGLNGAGKTTTVRILSGALAPTGGEARVAGIDVERGSLEVRRQVGVVFGENIAPEPGWSPVRYLRYFGALQGMEPRDVEARATDLLRRLRLAELAERPIGKLSGGNRRKVEIARALLHAPRVLFLDEPTRELDIPSKHATWEFLRALNREGTTLFVSSHDVQEVQTLCSRIGVVRGGRLAWEGGIGELGADLVPRLSSLLEGEAA